MNSFENIWIEKVKRRYVLFSLICLGYFAYGCNTTLIGITFQDLTKLLCVDSKNVSYGITIRYVTNCFAAILAGLSFNLFSRQLQYAISLLVYGILMIIMPLIHNVSFYFIFSALIGLASAFIDCTTNLWVFELFDKNINLHVLITHFSYSIGQLLAPLIVRPYLSVTTNNLIKKQGDNLSNECNHQQTSQIRIPFFICGLPFVIVALLVVICYIIKPYIPPERFIESKDIVALETINQNEMNYETKKSPLPRYYYKTFLVIISLILGLEVACELNLNFYLPIYLNRSDLLINRDTVSLMMSMIGLAYCLGRFLCIMLASFKVHVLIMLYLNLISIVAGNLILTFLSSNRNELIVWFSISLLGFGYSTTFPCLFSFIESRITITNNLNSFLVFVTSSVFTINSLLIGNSIDQNPALFQYLNSIFSISFVILFVLPHLTDAWKKMILKNI